jgi:hypothetical protein
MKNFVFLASKKILLMREGPNQPKNRQMPLPASSGQDKQDKQD